MVKIMLRVKYCQFFNIIQIVGLIQSVFHRHDTSKAVIKINNKEVKLKQSMCVLGVHFDNRLTC